MEADPYVPFYQPEPNGHDEEQDQWIAPEAVQAVVATQERAEAVEPADVFPVSETVAVEEQSEPVYVEEMPVEAWTPAETFVETEATETQATALTEATAETESGWRALAGNVNEAVTALVESFQDVEANRDWLAQERAQLQVRVHELEEEVEHKERFRRAIVDRGESLTTDDLKALQTMTESLNEDPDRLTVLFNVVQHAPQLATAIGIYIDLRQMAEE